MRGRLPAVLLGVFLLVAAVLGIDPYDRGDWLLENALVVAVLAVLLAGHRRRPRARRCAASPCAGSWWRCSLPARRCTT
jgi:putative membrane protein